MVLGLTLILDAIHLWARLTPDITGPISPLTFNDLNPQLPLIGFTIVGVLIIRRFPLHLYGWICCLEGLVSAIPPLFRDYALAGFAHPGLLPGPSEVQWVWSWLALLATVGAPVTFFFLPDGALPSRRWRPVLIASLLFLLVAAAAAAVAPGKPPGMPYPNPFGVEAVVPGAFILLGSFWAVFALIQTVAYASLFARYARADARGQQQLRPLILLGWSSPASFWLVAALMTPAPPAWLGPIVAIVTPLSIISFPPALAIAVFRYRLYDVDVVISRTLAYGAWRRSSPAYMWQLSLGSVHWLAQGAVQTWSSASLPPRSLPSASSRSGTGSSARPTGWYTASAPRRMKCYPSSPKVWPRRTPRRRSSRGWRRYWPKGQGAVSATVWLRRGSEVRPAATHPADTEQPPTLSVAGEEMPDVPGADHCAAVRYHGALLGALTLSKRHGETITPVERNLADDLANQAGLVLKNVGLTTELMQRLDELRDSRQRILAAQDDERRRLERNLHDGAQQNLVALK